MYVRNALIYPLLNLYILHIIINSSTDIKDTVFLKLKYNVKEKNDIILYNTKKLVTLIINQNKFSNTKKIYFLYLKI